jgi:hypothetical protein
MLSVEGDAGNDTFRPIQISNSTIESPIYLNSDVTFVSTANRYGGSPGGGVVTADTSETRITSISDTFLAPSKGFALSNGARVVNVLPSGGVYSDGLGLSGGIIDGVSVNREMGSCTLSSGVCPIMNLTRTYKTPPYCFLQAGDQTGGSGVLTGILKYSANTTQISIWSVINGGGENTDTALVSYVCMAP